MLLLTFMLSASAQEYVSSAQNAFLASVRNHTWGVYDLVYRPAKGFQGEPFRITWICLGPFGGTTCPVPALVVKGMALLGILSVCALVVGVVVRECRRRRPSMPSGIKGPDQ